VEGQKVCEVSPEEYKNSVCWKGFKEQISFESGMKECWMR